MKQLLPVLLGIILGLNACNNPGGSLSWKDQQVTAKENGCDSGDCTFADLRYITFSGTAADSLNKEVNAIMGTSFIGEELVVTSPKESAEGFVAAFEELRKEDSTIPFKWTLDRELRVDTLFKNVVTLRFDESNYTGGAHGNYFTLFTHYQLSPYKSLFLADFLNDPADTTQVTRIAEEIFRDKQELGKDENLEAAGYFFTHGVFRLNENFHFTKEGVEFHFNIYEIQPYASGEYRLIIPYERINKLLKINTLAAAKQKIDS